MSSDEEQETVSPMKRKRGRPSKAEQDSLPRKAKKASDDDMDGIHYACDVCDQVFLHKSNYLRHSERHDPPGGFVCSLCQVPFTTEWDRNKHKRDEHSVFRCRICQAEFPLEADYVEHIQQEHEGRDCEYDMCPKCGQQFKSATQLKVHVESKCGTEKNYKCSECSALHLTQASLNTHMLEHEGQESHQCSHCGSSFPSKDQLTVHERLHTDPKPFKCNKCDKAFAKRDNLITHFLTHSGSKPYSCSFCDDRFSCIGNLLKHRRARPDTCGLPQHCVTQKTSPRPSITKTMPSLIKTPVKPQKEIQRVEPPKTPKYKTEVSRDEKPVITKTLVVPKTVVKPPEDKKPNVSKLMVDENRERKKKSDSQQKMVVFKVVKSDGEMNGENSNQSAEQDLVEICEVKIEDDGTIREQKPKDSSDVDDELHEILFETVIEPDGTLHLSTNENQASKADEFSDDDDYPDQDDSEDYKPPQNSKTHDYKPPVYDSKGFRRHFTEKPPVITDVRKRGRKKLVKPPIPVSENVIVLDLEAQQREIDEQRCVFDLNVHTIAADCYRCAHCPMQYVTAFMAGRHLEKDHGIVLRELLKTLKYDREAQGERKFACRYCNRLYISKAALDKHVELHGPDGTLLHKCSCCPRHFATPEEVLRHAIEDHGGYLQCQICAKVFKKHCILKKHIRVMHEATERTKKLHYVCPKCGKAFSSRGQVSDHERSNCGKNPVYVCEICQKACSTGASLKIHYGIHSDEYPHSCQYCGKGFRSRGQVKVHERQHTGEKPFQCEYCPKAFSHRETLHTHRSMHTGIKRYMCSGCGQRFACVSNLQCHLRSHRDTCGTVPKVSRVSGPDGYHDLPEGYVLPFPKYPVSEDVSD